MLLGDKDILVWLNHLGGISYNVVMKLQEYFGGLVEIWEADEKEVLEALNKHRIIANRITQNRDKTFIEKIYQRAGEENIKILTILDEAYPDKLRNIYDSPYVIYINGNAKFDLPLISIVGSRKASPYGKWAAYQFAKELSQWGIGVISGLALGIDAASHKGTLDNKGYTIGVLGSGVEQCYPVSNSAIMKQMIETGCVLSEYAPGTPPMKHHFPARNRIISGLSDGVIVIEAAEKSGALITVEYALDHGKEVYALPGNINQLQSKGTNKLIRDGAKILLSIEDIIEDLKKSYPLINNCNKVATTEQLGEIEEKIYSIIRQGQISIDLIAYKSGLKIKDLSSILTILEIKGFINQLPGKTFTVNR
ncbi:DNA-processing protein DprA [Alkaliphilus hydrothermalis]|uniref:DNA processing protein n=1 Tax=Alkaliphilus hydrothermalis TaxID=1482730 RepID=A0ABS2NL28_9FIRM|nr:DNA-processing protein DprA [Alkaliphilus hydrothermalis]MBM7613648.1 DNA processing protein [Alkaliphilus hydrothermalis]